MMQDQAEPGEEGEGDRRVEHRGREYPQVGGGTRAREAAARPDREGGAPVAHAGVPPADGRRAEDEGHRSVEE